MRHLLWLIPLTLGALLLLTVHLYPLDDSNGREFLALMFFIVAFILRQFVSLDMARDHNATSDNTETPSTRKIHFRWQGQGL